MSPSPSPSLSSRVGALVDDAPVDVAVLERHLRLAVATETPRPSPGRRPGSFLTPHLGAL